MPMFVTSSIVVVSQLNGLLTNRTKMIEVDLTVAHSDYALGLEISVNKTMYWFTIERCDSAMNYKLKQTDDSLSGIFRASQGRAVRQHNFKDIVVSNPVGSGVCRFLVGYWED